MTRTGGRGFTLLELLVALAVFAVLTVLAYGGLRDTLRRDGALRSNFSEARQLEVALLLLEQDLKHARRRGVRDEFGDPEPALRAGLDGDLLSLTRVGDRLPVTDRVASDLSRVRYRLDQGALYRDVWDQLDRVPGTTYTSRRLLDAVTALELRFLTGDSWNSFWPPNASTVDSDSDQLPRGVEILIELGPGRSLRRVVALSG